PTCTATCELDLSGCQGVGWPQAAFGSDRRAQSPYVGNYASNPACTWLPPDGNPVLVTVVGADGTLYGQETGDAVAYTPSGTLLWRKSVGVPEALDPTGTVIYTEESDN